jgi:hypothetical protein
METVTIDGVEYVKAAVLGKKYRYTSDYIGQLCRAGKVDAHLVGRTWYVYPPSLESHQSTRYSEVRSAEKIQDKVINSKISRLNVEPPLSKRTVRAPDSHFEKRVTWKQPAYTPDHESLLPTVAKNPAKLVVELSDAEHVKVVSKNDNVSFVGEPPPAIALKGTLKIQDFTSDVEIADPDEYVDNIKNHYENASDVENDAVSVRDEVIEDKRDTPMVANQKRTPHRRTERYAYDVAIRHEQADFAPVDQFGGHAHEAKVAAARTSPSTVVPELTVSDLSPAPASVRIGVTRTILLLVVGFSVVAALLTLETQTVIEDGKSQSASVHFDPQVALPF